MDAMKGIIRILISVTLLLGNSVFLSHVHAAERKSDPVAAMKECQRRGWIPASIHAGGRDRALLWKQPYRRWRKGAIIVMHGGGGSHYHFCSGGKLVQPQIDFAKRAVAQGFAVFLLDSTDDVVTDAAGRQCGKRFDFSVLDRPNVDLPFIEHVITQFIPTYRPKKSATKIFLTGLSTGGYMTIRAATHLDDKITAFAPISAGDPYGTQTNCDPRLSPRKSAKGILTDVETGKQITEPGACVAEQYSHEQTWETGNPRDRPVFRQFHNKGDAIVDISCMQKAGLQLRRHGYHDAGAFILESSTRKPLYHLWLKRYNQPILEFFKRQ